jgi:pimeloyl-ACP methyl ester carboxylesterase
MSRTRRVLRGVAIGLAWLLGAVAVLAAGIIGKAEWDARTAVPGPVPTSFEVSASATGGDAAPVLILLHGAGLNGHMWDPVRRHLDPRYRVIALDLPGHGSSRDARYSPEAAAASVAAAASSVAPAPVVLVGDSLGGYSAMAAASAVPTQQLRGLVIAGCSSDFGWPQVLRYLRDVVMIRAMSVFIDESVFVGKALASLGVGEQDGRAIVAAGVHVLAVPVAVRSLLLVDFKARLARIEQPVLVVNGTLDARAMSQEASFVAAAPHATAYHFDNTQHGVSMRRSAEFAALVNDFAARAFSMPPAPKP